jgi:hypothetical protein
MYVGNNVSIKYDGPNLEITLASILPKRTGVS